MLELIDHQPQPACAIYLMWQETKSTVGGLLDVDHAHSAVLPDAGLVDEAEHGPAHDQEHGLTADSAAAEDEDEEGLVAGAGGRAS